MFKKGDKVLCITSGSTNPNSRKVIEGEVYILSEGEYQLNGDRVVEIIIDGIECVWLASRFIKQILKEEKYPLITYSKIIEEVPVGAN